MICSGVTKTKQYQNIVESFLEIWKNKVKTIDISKDFYMLIDLKLNWSESLKKN